MNKREALQSILMQFQEQAGETPHVYFDPPESVKMVYPCFVYHYIGNGTLYSDGKPYLQSEEYSVRYITKKADPDLPKAIMQLPYVAFDSHYTADNLHHFMFMFRGEYGMVDPPLQLDRAGF